SKAPIAVGAFDLRRGFTTAVGQRLDFSRGRLSFTGDLAPELDFVAQTQAGNVTAQVEVSGPPRSPFSPSPRNQLFRRTKCSRAFCSRRPQVTFPPFRLFNLPRQWRNSQVRAYLRRMRSTYSPCLPTSGKVVPATSSWLHEVKYDGYRLIVVR